MLVRNINGTNGHFCLCANWLEHWRKFSGQALPSFCVESDCANKPETGANVQLDGDHQRWYIIPLCKEHNALRGKDLTIIDTVKLVTADIRETCGKDEDRRFGNQQKRIG